MDDSYVKIPEEAFHELLSLLNAIIADLPSMPHHERRVLYRQVEDIEDLVLKEESEEK